jgi:predicted PurR-regulated permease PerM
MKNSIFTLGVIIILLICVIAYLLIPKSDVSADIKASIDSLTVENRRLLKSQEHLDSAINIYRFEVNQLDSQIANIDNKTVIINRYYNTIGQQVDKYTPTQIDSFFKKRYNY